MPVFAITGNWGSGKSTVCAILAKRGAILFDADQYVHQLYRNRAHPVYKKVAHAFPQACVAGRIDRKTLGAIVFSNPAALAKLENLVHPVVIRQLRIWAHAMRRHRRSVAIAEVPLLFEKKLVSLFDATIMVHIPRQTLMRRIGKQQRYSATYIDKRLALYVPVATKIKQADFVIDNSATRARLRKEIDKVWDKLNEYVSREKKTTVNH